MMLRSIRIEGVRQFRNPIELRDLGLGVHVVHAPNEKGKSTLFTAVARALCDRYSTHGADIEGLRPWGTSLSPTVDLEISVADKRYKVHKRFLEGAESVLDEWTGAGYERLADGQDADDRVREFIHSSLPGRGATTVGHWGVAQLLWLTQDPSRHDLPNFDGLRQRLLGLVGATALGPREQSLVERIKEVYEEYFTPRKGKAVKGSVIRELEQQRATVADDLAAWTSKAENAKQLAEVLVGVAQDLATFDAEARRYRAELAELKERALAELAIEKQAAASRSTWEQLGTRFAVVDSQRKTLATLDERRTRARKLAVDLTPQRDEAGRALEANATQRQRNETDSQVARTDCDDAVRRLERQRAIERALQLADDRRRIAELVEKAERIAATLARKSVEAASPAPTEAEVREAEALEKKIALLQAQLDAVGFKVTFTPCVAAELAWETSDGNQTQQARPDEPAVFRGADAGTLRIAGAGVVQIRSGAEEVSTLKQKLAARRGEFSRRLGEHQAKDVAQLRALWAAAQAREVAMETLRAKLADILTDDHADVASAQGALTKVSGQLAELLTQWGLDDASLEAEKGTDAKRLAEQVKAARARLARCDEAVKQSLIAERAAEKRFADLEKDRAGHEREATTLDAQHAAAIAANGSLESLDAEAARLGAEAALAEAAARGLESQLPAMEQRAAARQRRVEEALEGLTGRERQALDHFSRGRALLDHAGSEGAYSKRCEAEEKLAELDEQLTRERRKADAARLLSGLADAQRERSSRSLVDPVEKEVRLRLDFLRGGAASKMELAFGGGLASVEVTAPGGARLPLGTLSWGAREQAMFALRLALGAMLSRDGADPQLVVLDDALVNTDSLRQGRAIELIQSAAEHLQIVVLTAFPERYRMPGAREYDLAAMARAGA